MFVRHDSPGSRIPLRTGALLCFLLPLVVLFPVVASACTVDEESPAPPRRGGRTAGKVICLSTCAMELDAGGLLTDPHITRTRSEQSAGSAPRWLRRCQAELLRVSPPALRAVVRAHLRLLQALGNAAQILVRAAVIGIKSQDRTPLIGGLVEPPDSREGQAEMVAVVGIARIEPNRVL